MQGCAVKGVDDVVCGCGEWCGGLVGGCSETHGIFAESNTDPRPLPKRQRMIFSENLSEKNG